MTLYRLVPVPAGLGGSTADCDYRLLSEVIVPVLRHMDDVGRTAFSPAPSSKLATLEAAQLLLAIAIQESGLSTRVQRVSRAGRLVDRPDLAVGLLQFEAAGVRAVLTHALTARWCAALGLSTHNVERDVAVLRGIMLHSDYVTFALGRLLLLADPTPLPVLDAHPKPAYDAYVSAWGPGKPHWTRWATAAWPRANAAIGRLAAQELTS